MPEMHLKQPGKLVNQVNQDLLIVYVDHLPKIKKEFRNKKTGNSRYIYKNELDKACFQHDLAYGDFKDLAKRTASDKVLRDKAFNIAKNTKHYGFFQWFINFLIRNLLHVVVIEMNLNKITISWRTKQINYQKIWKRKVDSSFKDNIWGPDLAEM